MKKTVFAIDSNGEQFAFLVDNEEDYRGDKLTDEAFNGLYANNSPVNPLKIDTVIVQNLKKKVVPTIEEIWGNPEKYKQGE